MGGGNFFAVCKMAALLAGEPVITLLASQPGIIATPQASRVPMKDDTPDDTLAVLLIAILISVIVFVVIISIYDVIKERLVVMYTADIAKNPIIAKSAKKAAKMNIEAQASYDVVVTFSMITTSIALIILPILFLAYHNIGCKHE